ncbi:transmembrane channel-like protein 7 [Caerostris darwini]|uniref:Transmembrane channel-like protein 7 n=1 Tax=Caerostris darwini TaxID=1538125 RepID=A0AAV4W2Q4_9ARAC|nr:transmembrane channel-like protein 7 [Caerostris darwini]
MSKENNTSEEKDDQKNTSNIDDQTDSSVNPVSTTTSKLDFEEDVSNIAETLDIRASQTKIDVEKKALDGDNTHVVSTTLASQIKKIAPSINIFDKEQDESKESSSTSLSTRSVSSVRASQYKVLRFESSRKLSIVPENEYDDSLQLDADACTKKNIEDAIKNIPAPLQMKRQRRNTLMILPKKTPWYEEVKNFLNRIYSRLNEYQMWNEDLKVIEGRYGVAVLSYFLFIRWLLGMNIIILLLNLFFLVFPQLTATNMGYQEFNKTFENDSTLLDMSMLKYSMKNKELINDEEIYREKMYTLKKFVLPDIITKSVSSEPTNITAKELSERVSYCRRRYQAEYHKMQYTGFFAKIQGVLDGRGWLEPTLLFIGAYVNEGVTFLGLPYNVPLAFLWVFTISFIICFIMMIRYSSFGIEDAFLRRHRTIYFANEIFSSWNYCIRTKKAASLQHESFVTELKSELSEAHQRKELKERSLSTWMKLYFIRLLMNVLVLLWIAGCYVLIYHVAFYQLTEQKKEKLEEAGFRTLVIQYLPPFTVLSISIVSPVFFSFLVSFEKYHAQTEVNVSLIRNAFLSLSSVIVLVNAFHQEVTCEPKDICGAGKAPDCNTPGCWETYVGQQLYKLNLSQLFVIIAIFVLVDVPTQLGVFYSPLLPLVTVIKLIVLFYVKKTTVLQCREPSKVHYKAARFNSTFINILLLSYFAILIVHFYTIRNIRSSFGCSPFSYYPLMLQALREAFNFLPFDIVFLFMFILSGWVFLPCSIILCTVVYYYRRYLAFLTTLEDNLKSELTVLEHDKKFILKRIEALSNKTVDSEK